MCSSLLYRAADPESQIWDAINDGTIYSCPSLLASFAMICFADLKKYKFTYLFAFPALHSEPSWRIASQAAPLPVAEGDSDVQDSSASLTSSEATALVDAVQTWRYSVDVRQYGFFLAKKKHRAFHPESDEGADRRPTTPGNQTASPVFEWIIGSLASYEDRFFQGAEPEDQFVCFADPSNYQSYPGWMLRNLLVLVRKRWKLDRVQVLCYRDIQTQRHEARSMVLHLDLGEPTCNAAFSDEMPKVTGWERSSTGKVTSKVANLGEYMDPQR